MVTTGTIEDLQRDWETFESAVGAIPYGDVTTFHELNQTMGWNLAKAVPILLTHSTNLEREIRNLEARNRTLEGQVTAGLRATQKAEKELKLYKSLNE